MPLIPVLHRLRQKDSSEFDSHIHHVSGQPKLHNKILPQTKNKQIKMF